MCDDLVIMDHGQIVDQGSPPQLIQRHVEKEVVEIREAATVANGLLDSLSGCRTEWVGDTFYCYTDDARPVVAQIDGIDKLVFLHRPANLEDVFLKLTGRDLKD